MKRKKLLSAALALSLGIGSAGAGALPGAFAAGSSASPTLSGSGSAGAGAFDLAIANEDRLVAMLKADGRIAANATPAEAQAAVSSFLRAKAQAAADAAQDGELQSRQTKRDRAMEEKLLANGLTRGSGNKLGQAKKNVVPSAQAEAWNGGRVTDRVLVLLIEYPDFPANAIAPEETDMYYDEYLKSHYEDMVFGADGYAGPNGERLTSMKQYYEAQSGGSYTVEGEVAGWYMASQPSSYYGANYPGPDDNDIRPRALVQEALLAAAADPSIDLASYDQEDRYDLDGDGDLREPDGLVDHLMVVHSSVGEEAGGGALGGDAVWSHRSNLGGVATLPGTTASVPYWGGLMGAYDYTIQPADGAAGVFAHEYGHDLGLPDEYDTIYSGQGEAVGYWSIMSSGSWAGAVPGTEPTGFSAWSKEFLQANLGGNWLSGSAIHIDDIPAGGVVATLDEAVTKGANDDVVRIDLPDKVVTVNTPYSGEYEYYSGRGDELDRSMTTTLDLTGATGAALTFKTWYQIEEQWDFGSVQVRAGGGAWESIPGNLTTTQDDYGQNPGHGITGHSNGWVEGWFDLSAYAGQSIELRFNYWTDVAVSEMGWYIDDIAVTIDGETVLSDGAEASTEPAFALDGFTVDTGTFTAAQYYLLEWRSHNGVDAGLAHILRGDSLMSYDPGLLIWYVDESYTDNWTGIHPGEGFLGLVDADQKVVKWSDGVPAASRFQLHDAAFGLEKGEKMDIDYTSIYGLTITDPNASHNPLFNDGADYANAGLPDAGRLLPQFGLKVGVIGEASDRSAAQVLIYK
ncbi:M6 family metalloprotease domain-containing protein [Paenibacillus antri]|uniref:M6 family metalloprotease domain-containing protein n=1 Tax=Paenibacillus antri TaxID=2582848 RepID=A0A5R9G7C0_9BACL|nr:immune inhibitor A domain-containing protein [Paenibacillus antri]TLS49338.1 M6 family metalloprotease domain-containing protein [Paenibacillus antri]